MADDTDTLRRPSFADDQGDQTADFLSREYESPADAHAAGVDPAYAAGVFRAAGNQDLADQYDAYAHSTTAPAPAIAAPPPAPVPAWDTVASHPEFAKLTPGAKQAVVDQYADKAREFASTLPGAPDSAALDSHFSTWTQTTKDRLVNPLTPDQQAVQTAVQGDASAQSTLAAPEGSPEALDALRAKPLSPNAIPSATATPLSLEDAVASALPRQPAAEVSVPRRIPGDYNTAQDAYHDADGGIAGVINAFDFVSKQPVVNEDQAKQFVGLAAGAVRLAGFDSPTGNSEAEKGVEDRLSQELSSWTSPEGLGQLVLLKNPVARAVFAGQAIAQIPGDISSIKQAIDSGDQRGLGQAVAGAALNAVMGAAMAWEPVGGKLHDAGILKAKQPAEELLSDLKTVQETAPTMPETAKVLADKAHTDFTAATAATKQQAHADELAAFHEEPAVQAAGEAEAGLRSEQPISSAATTEPTISSPSPNAMNRAADFLSNIDSEPSSVAKQFGSLDVESRSVVLPSVLRVAREQPQVLDAVIRSVPVDVMNDFLGAKLSTDELLHNPAMLVEKLAANTDSSVALRISSGILALARSTAEHGAKVFDSDVARLLSERDAASATSNEGRLNGVTESAPPVTTEAISGSQATNINEGGEQSNHGTTQSEEASKQAGEAGQSNDNTKAQAERAEAIRLRQVTESGGATSEPASPPTTGSTPVQGKIISFDTLTKEEKKSTNREFGGRGVWDGATPEQRQAIAEKAGWLPEEEDGKAKAIIQKQRDEIVGSKWYQIDDKTKTALVNAHRELSEAETGNKPVPAEWKEYPGSKIQAPLSVSGDYVISHRPKRYTVSYRPEGKHEHVGQFETLDEAKAAVEDHQKSSAEAAQPAPRSDVGAAGQPETGIKQTSAADTAGSVISARKALQNTSDPLVKEWWQQELKLREETAREVKKGDESAPVAMESHLSDQQRAEGVAEKYKSQAKLRLRDLGDERTSDNAYKYGLTETDPAKLVENARRVIAAKNLQEAQLPIETGARPVSFDEFSNERGISSTPPSFPETHRAPGGVSKATAKATSERIQSENAKWQQQRNQLQEEYDQKIAAGEIRQPARIEKLQKTAQGQGSAAEAAKRLLAKSDTGSKPVSIAAAAIRTPDGKVLTGASHPDIESKHPATGGEYGFVDSRGKFLNREQALEVATKSKQITEETREVLEEKAYDEPGLHATDLDEFAPETKSSVATEPTTPKGSREEIGTRPAQNLPVSSVKGISSVPKKYAKLHSERVASEWNEGGPPDGDGYWIQLKPGWTVDDSSAIHEWTRGKALERLPEAIFTEQPDTGAPPVATKNLGGGELGEGKPAGTSNHPSDEGQVSPSAQKPTDIANTTAADLGKALQVPKAATALRVTTDKGKVSIVRAADLKGDNVLRGAGPFKKIEAGTIGKGNVFLPMKEKITAKPAAASGIAAPGLASRVANALRPLEDEENHFEPAVKDVSTEEPSGSSAESGLSEEGPGAAALTSLKDWTSAHEDATTRAVTDALSREGGTKGVGTDLADQVSKRYATVNKVLSRNEGAPGAREHLYDLLRDDLLANARNTGDAFKVKTASDKTVPYAAEMRARTKLQQFNELHENANARGEAADIAGEITPAPKDNTRYHEAVQTVADTAESVVKDFSNRVGFEGHSPEAVAAATEAVLKEQGFSKGVQGRPSAETQEILSHPEFRDAVQKNVFEKIADAVQKHYDESIFGLVPTPDGIAGVIPHIGPALAKLNDLRKGLTTMWRAKPARDIVTATADAIDTKARVLATQAENHVALEVGRKPLDLEAMTPVVEAKGSKEKMAADAAKVDASPKASVESKSLYRYALKNFERLNEKAGVVNEIHAKQLQDEHTAGINTDSVEGYVAHRFDIDMMLGADKPVILDATGGKGGGAAYFKKQRVFNSYADAIAEGYQPRTMDVSKLVNNRVAAGQRIINQRAWVDSLRGVTNPVDGMPLVTDLITQPKGTQVAPSGYQAMMPFPGVSVAVNQYFAPLIDAITGRSQVPRVLSKAEAGIKHSMLVFDSFHAMRMIYKQAYLNQQVGYGRGKTLLDYSDGDLAKAVKGGEITQDMADYAKNNRPAATELINKGLNVGSYQDALYKDVVGNLPVVGTFNKWVFDKLTRGAMMQSAIWNLERNTRLFPEMPHDVLVRRSAKEMNEFFGNLRSQGLFKSRTFQDLSRIMMLAPNWVEGMVRTEAKGYGQIGQSAVDLAKGKARVGSLGRAMGTGLVGMFTAGQIVNLLTTGHPTWQNPDQHKFDAYIPDWIGGSQGFYLSPFAVPAEVTHDFIRYAYREPYTIDAASHIISNKLSPLMHGARDVIFNKDFFGRPLGGLWERTKQAAADIAPVPLPLRALSNQYKGAAQRQIFGSFGLKIEPAPSANNQIYSMADKFKRDNHVKVSDVHETSDYANLKAALRNGDNERAAQEYQKLRQSKKDSTVSAYFQRQVDAPFTGTRANETKFRKGLNREQLDIYNQARQERQELARRFYQLKQSPQPKP